MMGISRRTLNELCQERRGVTADLAHRLAIVFGTTPDVWINMQSAVDIWDSLQKNKTDYKRIKPLKVA
jgi:addiction module HigA family antidote